MKITRFLVLSSMTAALWWVAGCASHRVEAPAGRPVEEMSPEDPGFVVGTGIESQDLVTVSEKMVRSILALPQIAQAATPPVIVLDPVLNKTRFPINKDIFLTRIRSRMNASAAGKIQFLARDRMAVLERERDMKASGAVVGSAETKAPELKGADYFLTGSLESISTRTSQGQSDYILYSFQLIDARTSVITWEDSAEIKKQGLEDAAYR